MASRSTKEWFEMRDVTRTRLATGVWIPLYVSDETGEHRVSEPNHWSEYNGIRTFAVLRKDRMTAEAVDWSQAAQTQEPYVNGKKYYPVEMLLSTSEKPIGVHLALIQNFSGNLESEWTLNQDLIFALNLLREGDTWLSPQDGYTEVAQLRRNSAGKRTGLYIKPEYLKDYLAARKMALRIVQFRQRQATLRAIDTFGWLEKHFREERDGGSFVGSAWPVGGETVMVMQVGRTDNWSSDELPEMGPPSDSNIVSEHRTFNRPQHGLHAIEGEFRREEWLEAAVSSPRVRHDKVPSAVTFIVDGAGHRQSADQLNDEDIGKWLWFKPGVVPAILSYRGALIKWYTRFTAGILLSSSSCLVHFGLNSKGFVVTYASDVARLLEWERVIWAGFNVAPDGGLPDELKQAQVEGEAANTQAPEEFFGKALVALDAASNSRWGWPLLREHASTEDIVSSIHRYRALDESGFLALAKDIARLTADSIDSARLQTLVTLAKGEKLGSLKSLERGLGTLVSSEEARSAMTVLVGVYNLRLGDAHLPSEKLREAFGLAGISEEEPPLFRAAHLIHNVTAALFRIAKLIDPSK
ncbi:hypothetical protein [Acetobacter senegalensis]|uniref:hypothetical protein n=1 Tax=Acetobacter senegalensis TaxID=446692 RepID=UPI00128BD981|nr:hypothetical protein [Acetobacter senegalensis]MCG4257677.1 hypothetical protein [Acetobacter senegalensis]MCG4267743.1 hypothetical protein [Acetobacter senegalensis]MPQ74807.1 hypothetical protein [Acetobacter senegalensis]